MATNANGPGAEQRTPADLAGWGIVPAAATLAFSAFSILLCWFVWADFAAKPFLDGATLARTILPLPFIALSWGGWTIAFRRYRFSETGGIPVHDDGAVARLGTSRFDPALAAVIAAGLTSFPLSFVVLWLENRITLPIAALICLIVLAAAAGSTAYSIRRVVGGAGDVVLDRVCEVLSLPASSDRMERLTVNWASITHVRVSQCNKPCDWSLGDHGLTVGGSNFLFYAPVIVVSNERGGVACEERVFSFMFEAEANRLAEWLCHQIGRQPEASHSR